jgi:hypothetical protein
MRWVDQMSGLQLFAVSVAVYAVLPLVFALLPSPYRALLLYTTSPPSSPSAACWVRSTSCRCTATS